MKRCPKCQTEFHGDERFCPSDGSRLVAVEETGTTRSGERLDQEFERLRSLGRDELGEVFVARDRAVGSFIALKEFHHWVRQHEPALQRYREALDRLKGSPVEGVPLLISHRMERAEAYVASELIQEFVTLEGYLKSRDTVGLDQLVELMAGVVDILASLHELGLIHGGLTPRKILLTDSLDPGGLYLTDPGQYELWRVDNPILTSRRTPDRYLGNAPYYSPEAALGKQLGPRSDLYTVGVILYEILAGKPSFVASSFGTTLKRQIYERPLPPRLVRPGLIIPQEVDSLLETCLSKDPNGRFETAGALRNALLGIRERLAATGEIVVGLTPPGAIAAGAGTWGQPTREESGSREAAPSGSYSLASGAEARSPIPFPQIVEILEEDRRPPTIGRPAERGAPGSRQTVMMPMARIPGQMDEDQQSGVGAETVIRGGSTPEGARALEEAFGALAESLQQETHSGGGVPAADLTGEPVASAPPVGEEPLPDQRLGASEVGAAGERQTAEQALEEELFRSAAVGVAAVEVEQVAEAALAAAAEAVAVAQRAAMEEESRPASTPSGSPPLEYPRLHRRPPDRQDASSSEARRMAVVALTAPSSEVTVGETGAVEANRMEGRAPGVVMHRPDVASAREIQAAAMFPPAQLPQEIPGAGAAAKVDGVETQPSGGQPPDAVTREEDLEDRMELASQRLQALEEAFGQLEESLLSDLEASQAEEPQTAEGEPRIPGREEVAEPPERFSPISAPGLEAAVVTSNLEPSEAEPAGSPVAKPSEAAAQPAPAEVGSEAAEPVTAQPDDGWVAPKLAASAPTAPVEATATADVGAAPKSDDMQPTEAVTALKLAETWAALRPTAPKPATTPKVADTQPVPILAAPRPLEEAPLPKPADTQPVPKLAATRAAAVKPPPSAEPAIAVARSNAEVAQVGAIGLDRTRSMTEGDPQRELLSARQAAAGEADWAETRREALRSMLFSRKEEGVEGAGVFPALMARTPPSSPAVLSEPEPVVEQAEPTSVEATPPPAVSPPVGVEDRAPAVEFEEGDREELVGWFRVDAERLAESASHEVPFVDSSRWRKRVIVPLIIFGILAVVAVVYFSSVRTKQVGEERGEEIAAGVATDSHPTEPAPVVEGGDPPRQVERAFAIDRLTMNSTPAMPTMGVQPSGTAADQGALADGSQREAPSALVAPDETEAERSERRSAAETGSEAAPPDVPEVEELEPPDTAVAVRGETVEPDRGGRAGQAAAPRQTEEEPVARQAPPAEVRPAPIESGSERDRADQATGEAIEREEGTPEVITALREEPAVPATARDEIAALQDEAMADQSSGGQQTAVSAPAMLEGITALVDEEDATQQERRSREAALVEPVLEEPQIAVVADDERQVAVPEAGLQEQGQTTTETAADSERERVRQSRLLTVQAEEALRNTEYSLAEDLFTEAIDLDPRNARAQAGLGDVYFQRQDFSGARRAHRRAISFSRNNASYYSRLGMDYFRLGSYLEAIRSWERALELDPGDENAQRYIEIARERL
ncbi:MAG: tetratricopeptide repeat protein [Bradymonadales bacterium]|nr:tetratricopeptide repeat protein [Bradymonadales bacterium]